MLNSWQYCRANKGLEIYAYCIMTNHIHMIVGTNNNKLEDIIRDMKRHTSQQLRAAIENNLQESRREWMLNLMKQAGQANSNNMNFQLWHQDNHPIELPTHHILHQKLDYIHSNPVEAGFVEKPEDYLYSSAKNYYDLPALFEVTLVDPIVM
jgi:REP element-mobilizing transposase RayT